MSYADHRCTGCGADVETYLVDHGRVLAVDCGHEQSESGHPFWVGLHEEAIGAALLGDADMPAMVIPFPREPVTEAVPTRIDVGDPLLDFITTLGVFLLVIIVGTIAFTALGR